jgi:hypothetical protein
MEVKLEVVVGDITQQPADALIITVNSAYQGFGVADASLRGAANDYFHNKVARKAEPARNGQAIFVDGPHSNRLPFHNVIMVIDDFRPLSEIVVAGLNEADLRGLAHVTMALPREGIWAAADVLDELVLGARLFAAGKVESLQRITFVVSADPSTEHRLRQLVKTV